MGSRVAAVGLKARPRDLLLPLAAMAAARLVTLAVMAVAVRTKGMPFDAVIGSWDGAHYVNVAAHGYAHHPNAHNGPDLIGGRLAFFPRFPLAIRATVAITPLGFNLSALVVSLLSSLTAAAALWVLVDDVAGRAVANRVAVLFAFFPGAYVMSMVYAEGLMLTLVIASLYFLRHRRWLLAGIAAAVATASRPNAVVIVLCCAWAAFDAVRKDRDYRALIAPALAPLGAVIFFVYLWRHTGERLAWFMVQSDVWHERFEPFRVFHEAAYYWSHPLDGYQSLLVVTGAVIAVVGIALLIKDRAPVTLIIWAAGTVFLVLTSHLVGVRPRFVMTAFPLFIPYAKRLSPEAAGAATGVFGVLTGWIAFLTVTSLFFVP